jgi:hypothetical protein
MRASHREPTRRRTKCPVSACMVAVLARPTGFEPVTSALGSKGWRSIFVLGFLERTLHSARDARGCGRGRRHLGRSGGCARERLREECWQAGSSSRRCPPDHGRERLRKTPRRRRRPTRSTGSRRSLCRSASSRACRRSSSGRARKSWPSRKSRSNTYAMTFSPPSERFAWSAAKLARPLSSRTTASASMIALQQGIIAASSTIVGNFSVHSPAPCAFGP